MPAALFSQINWSKHTIDGGFDGATFVYAIDLDGDGDVDVLGAGNIADDITAYPNPFNSTATISFGLPKDSYVTIRVFNLTGCEVTTLIDGKLQAGWKNVRFDGSYLSSGIYFVSMQTQHYLAVKRIVLFKQE
ncbi:MAG: T9SS type A sorting domain-containing protein [candidate division WOR-3 bacterium]|nr:T9SS type A sorting domain-containing protein [candidate division WOR-3 bacterium]